MKAKNNNIFICICVIVIIITVVLFMRTTSYNPFNNVNANIDYPCRVVLSDNEFLRHMITHHQMAIDISIQHIKNTKNDIIMKVLRELIFTQKYEIILMLAELNHKTDNITTMAINNNDNITTMAIHNNDNNNDNDNNNNNIMETWVDYKELPYGNIRTGAGNSGASVGDRSTMLGTHNQIQFYEYPIYRRPLNWPVCHLVDYPHPHCRSDSL